MRVIRTSIALLVGTLAVLAAITAYFALGTLMSEPVPLAAATEHSSLARETCITCHAPIAEEWRQSFHFQSATGRFWQRLRARRFDKLFDVLRVPCMNCHAPANVLDLSPADQPVQRMETAELGVDCVSCHVSEEGILGPGFYTDAPHEVIPDRRFRDPATASVQICGRCHEEAMDHAKTVTAWQSTEFARAGVTCIHCHMPEVTAALVAGGPLQMRRSHRFPGDKDIDMLRSAVSAVVALEENGIARVTISNDGAGHSVPASGMNSLIVNVAVHDEAGEIVERIERSYGTREWIPGYLDFWPFLKVTKIPSGETREIVVELPSGHGTVAVELRYRDWPTITDQDVVFLSLRELY